MYCVKCGVELADSERKCPLCDTPVYFPGLSPEPETPYPKEKTQKENNPAKAICFVITCFFIIVAAISVLCDYNINDEITWADMVVGGLLLVYILLVLPAWFRNPSPAIFVPCDFLAIALLLLYINVRFGGDWYLTFALPVTVGAGIVCSSVSILAYYLKRGRLYIAAGALIATGAYSIFIEICLHAAFAIHDKLVWSPYPAITLTFIGIMLIVVAIVRPLREQLYKIFAF